MKHTDSGVSSKENVLSEYAKDPNYADNSDDDNKDGGNAPRYPQRCISLCHHKQTH